MKHEPYTCIRCNYSTERKNNMFYHLYKMKKTCPGTKNVIELTEEIKQHIMENRIYKIPDEPKAPTITNIINTNNTINNFIANMDPIEKINNYTTFKNIELSDFGDSIENSLRCKVRLLQNKRNDIAIDNTGLLEIVDQVSSLASHNIEDFNILYDDKYNKLKLYEFGSWNESIIISGVKTYLIKIQEFYLDNYEAYLIRKIELPDTNCRNKNKSRELLIEYYKFIGCFDIDPLTKDKTDHEILYDEESNDEDTSISEKYYALYVKTRDDIKKGFINTINKQVIDIIKKNSQRNVNELNKKVTSLFHMEEEFKNKITK